MKYPIPDFMNNLVGTTRDAFCDLLNQEKLWSETMIKRTLQKTGSQAFDIEDVRHIVRGYLRVLEETIRKGENIH